MMQIILHSWFPDKATGDACKPLAMHINSRMHTHPNHIGPCLYTTAYQMHSHIMQIILHSWFPDKATGDACKPLAMYIHSQMHTHPNHIVP